MKKYILFIVFFVFELSYGQEVFYHDTQGKLDVSSSGSAVYTVPIAMPPSIQNVGPVINLVYASGQLGGIAGLGWNISSISNISRIATRRDVDGFIDGVDFDDNDKLALDGQRLLLKSGWYGSGYIVYQTEVQSNTKIEQMGTGTSMYFIVTAPDGSRSWYGNYDGANAVDNTAYYITRFEDTNGNYMTYHYFKPFNKGFCIDEIRFSANVNDGINPQNAIKFYYEPTVRDENTYIKGIKQEKGEILTRIEVFTNSQLFRRYLITHETDPQLGYKVVKQIQEFNGAEEPANPLVFNYEHTQTIISPDTEKLKEYINNIEFDEVSQTGDFDGDGRLDFIASNNIYTKVFEGNSGNSPISLGSIQSNRIITTTKNNRLNQFQSIVSITQQSDSSTLYKVYDLVGNTLQEQFTKTINLSNSITHTLTNNTGSGYGVQCWAYLQNNYMNFVPPSPSVSEEGDFNGDGISELLFSRRSTHLTINNNPLVIDSPSTFDPIYCNFQMESTHEMTYYVLDMNPNASTTLGTPGFRVITDTNDYFLNYTKRIVQDFNGDGKSDILIYNELGQGKILEFVLTPTSSYIQLIGTFTIPELATYPSNNRIKLFGDYNGDGKTDIMIPDEEGSNLWHIYYSNPSPSLFNFFTEEQYTIVDFSPAWSGQEGQRINAFMAMDSNGDGKTDLVRVWAKKYPVSGEINNYDTTFEVYTYVNNIGNTAAGALPFFEDYHTWCSDISFISCNNAGARDFPIPIPNSFRDKGLSKELIIVRDNSEKLVLIDFTKDVASDSRLKTVTSSGGAVVNTIEYKDLIPNEENNGLGSLNDFYSSSDSVTYPLVEIKRAPSMKLVSKIKSSYLGIEKQQDFRYHGFVSNMDGIGAVGFRKMARSAWYINPSDKRIWSITENDPILRGATVRNYSQLLQNENDFSFVTTGNPIGIISSTVNEFSTSTSNGLYIIKLDKSTTKDFQTNVSNEVTFSYQMPYVLEESTVSKNYLGSTLQGTTTTTREYYNNEAGTGINYYIGRPERILTTTEAYSDSWSTEQKFTYTGTRLTKTEKKANNTDGVYITEEFEYFADGNVKKKTLSAPGATPAVAPRVTEYTYDETKRFVKTSKDIFGLETTVNDYHPLYGMPTSVSDPFGLTTLTIYDEWGKPLKVTDYLGNNDNYEYTTLFGAYITTVIKSDNSRSVKVSDALGRERGRGSNTLDGTLSFVSTEYDNLGRKIKESEAYYEGDTPHHWSLIEYDDYSRPIKTIAVTGLVTNIEYHDLQVITNDGTHVKSSTKNANGHTVSTSDNGGTITNTYYANGNLKDSTFDGTTVAMEYDGWGRKSKLTDPSAGEYLYYYNAYGETIREQNPKGRTDYSYDDYGRVTSKYIIGDNTNSTVVYNYHPDTKLLLSNTFTDAINSTITEYNYTYDTYNRVIVSDELTPNVHFVKAISYDGLGRVENETHTATFLADGASSTKATTNIYKNGYHWKLLDTITQQVLWQTDIQNAKGQVTDATFGNGIAIFNGYDDYGYLRTIDHHVGTTNKMHIDYDFDIQRANITTRKTQISGFSAWHENFEYDLLDRLFKYTDKSGTLVTQNYDNTGRITNNTVGIYNYDDPTKKYQLSKIKFDVSERQYYEDRDPQELVFNAFKCPVTIKEPGHETIDFEYNMDNSRSVMYYGDEETDKLSRNFRRYYSADGSMEITYNRSTDQTEFVTYIGGDAYSAPIILKKQGSTANYYYLHRDFQGTILAITNQTAQIVEQRLFDAWGFMIQYKNISGATGVPTTEGVMLLDRGYTGHEHLLGVGIINMNGRLYDPKIHRFLSPDNYIQDPSNTQNFNRYGYVLNNPLKYTDPSGEIIPPLLGAVALGALISAFVYTASAFLFHTPFTAGGFLQSVAIGAFSGAVTFGIGEWAKAGFTNFYSKATAQALGHGTFNGMMSGIQGGNFFSGFAAGCIASIASSLWTGGTTETTGFSQQNNWAYGAKTITHSGLGGSFASSGAGTILFGSVMGGAGASLTGGNFWNGAVIGGMVAGLNHMMHMDDGDQNPQEPKKGNQILKGYGKLNNFEAEVNIEYEYTIENGKYVVVKNSVNIYSSMDDNFSFIDNYKQDMRFSLQISPKITTDGKYIIFESVGTHVTGGLPFEGNTGFNPVAYKFTGVIDIQNSSKSFINVETIKGKLW